MNVKAWLIIILCVFSIYGKAFADDTAYIVDDEELSSFFSEMGGIYNDIKTAVQSLSDGQIATDEFAEKMATIKKEYDVFDEKAPCPKNNWQATYTELTPIHYDICFAWSDLGAMHTSLLTTDSDAIIFHESEFRTAVEKITEIFEHPDLNKETDIDDIIGQFR